MRLLHVADVHLGASYTGFGALAEQRRTQVLEAFRRLPDHAAEARAHAVLLAGDLFDGPEPGPDAMTAAREVLRRLVDLCIPVFVAPGNHDSITLKLNPYRELARFARVVVQNGDASRSREWPVPDEAGKRLAEKHSVYILTQPRFGEPVTVSTDEGPLHVYGVAYDRAECQDPLLTFQRARAPGVHVALLHACVRGPADWRVSRDTLTVGSDALHLLDVDYIALGDQHRPVLPDAFGGPPACYAGSFAATDLGETGARGFLLLDVEAGGEVTVEHRDAGVPQAVAVEVDVSACPDEAAAVEAAAALVPPGTIPLVRLLGEPCFPLDSDAMASRLAERFGHARVEDETRYYATERLEELSATDTVVGHVARLGRLRVKAADVAEDRDVAQQALRVALRGLGVR